MSRIGPRSHRAVAIACVMIPPILNHPSSNPSQPAQTRKELTPEERERQDKKKAMRDKMEQIRLSQQEEAENDDENDE